MQVDKDLCIYHTPEGELYSARNKQDNPGVQKKHKSADEKWEDQVRREIEGKKMKDQVPKTVPKDPVTIALLQEENTIRNKVKTIVRNVHSGLAVVRSICEAKWETLREQYSSLVLAVDSFLNYGEIKTTAASSHFFNNPSRY